MDGVGPGELHHIAEGGQALRSLLHQVPHQHQGVLRGEGGLFQQPLEPGQVAMDIADGQQPPPLREVDLTDHRFHNRLLIIVELWGSPQVFLPGRQRPAPAASGKRSKALNRPGWKRHIHSQTRPRRVMPGACPGSG